MASITPYQTKAGKRWRVRYRKPDRSQTDKRGFRTKRDAEAFAATVEVSKTTGTFIDPTAGRITIGELGPAWMARQTDWKPSYRRSIESTWRTHVQPVWANVPVADVRHTDVQAWAAGIDRSRSVVSRAVTILATILDDAIADQLIHVNRARGISLPRKSLKPHVYLSHAEVEAFATAAGGERAVIIYTLAYTGLRWGELAGLHAEDVDVHRRRLHVNRSAVEVGSTVEVGTPKSHELRSVPMPEFIADMLTEARPKSGIVFPNSTGGYRVSPRSARWWENAIRDAGIPRLSPHGLRHTAASLAVQAGAHVKALQRMMGHASAELTLQRYAGLFDTDLDDVAVSLDAARLRLAGHRREAV